MGTRKIGDLIVLDFTTHNPVSGMVQDADSFPLCEVFEGDEDVPILTPLATKRAGKTGNYRVTIDAIQTNGFEVGRSYNAIVAVTLNSITAKARIGSFTLDSKRNADLQDLAQSDILSDAVPFSGAHIDDLPGIKAKTDGLPPDPASESGTLANGVALARKYLGNRQELGIDGRMITYDDDDVTPLDVQIVTDKDGRPVVIPAGVPARRGRRQRP